MLKLIKKNKKTNRWSRNKNFHSRLCLDVNSLFETSTIDISTDSWGVCKRALATKTKLIRNQYIILIKRKKADGRLFICLTHYTETKRHQNWCFLCYHHPMKTIREIRKTLKKKKEKWIKKKEKKNSRKFDLNYFCMKLKENVWAKRTVRVALNTVITREKHQLITAGVYVRITNISTAKVTTQANVIFCRYNTFSF